jgi:hypothetical protein
MSWTTHRYRCTSVHVLDRGAEVAVVYQTHTHPPWEWVVLRRSRWLDWLDTERRVMDLPPVSRVAGCGGSWQVARRRAVAAMEATCAKP